MPFDIQTALQVGARGLEGVLQGKFYQKRLEQLFRDEAEKKAESDFGKRKWEAEQEQQQFKNLLDLAKFRQQGAPSGYQVKDVEALLRGEAPEFVPTEETEEKRRKEIFEKVGKPAEMAKAGQGLRDILTRAGLPEPARALAETSYYQTGKMPLEQIYDWMKPKQANETDRMIARYMKEHPGTTYTQAYEWAAGRGKEKGEIPPEVKEKLGLARDILSGLQKKYGAEYDMTPEEKLKYPNQGLTPEDESARNQAQSFIDSVSTSVFGGISKSGLSVDEANYFKQFSNKMEFMSSEEYQGLSPEGKARARKQANLYWGK